MSDTALLHRPRVVRTGVISVGLRRLLAPTLVAAVIVGAAAFVAVSSQEILRTSDEVTHAVSAPTVVAYGWSWWPLGVKTVYSDQTETVELW